MTQPAPKAVSQTSNAVSADTKKAIRGFTLIEILIVLALIGVLTTVVINSGIFDSFTEGEVDTAQLWLNSTGTTYIQTYYLQARKYPKSLDDLLSPAKAGGKPVVPRASSLLDPWDQRYQYKQPGTKNAGSFDLWTITPDGKKIGNWD